MVLRPSLFLALDSKLLASFGRWLLVPGFLFLALGSWPWLLAVGPRVRFLYPGSLLLLLTPGLWLLEIAPGSELLAFGFCLFAAGNWFLGRGSWLLADNSLLLALDPWLLALGPSDHHLISTKMDTQM